MLVSIVMPNFLLKHDIAEAGTGSLTQSTQEALKLKPELLQHIFYVVSISSFHFMQISLYENTSHAYVGNFIFIIPSFIEDMIKTTATKKIHCLPSLKLTFSYTFALEHQWFEDVICLWGPFSGATGTRYPAPVEVDSLTPYLQVLYILGGFLPQFLNHQQSVSYY